MRVRKYYLKKKKVPIGNKVAAIGAILSLGVCVCVSGFSVSASKKKDQEIVKLEETVTTETTSEIEEQQKGEVDTEIEKEEKREEQTQSEQNGETYQDGIWSGEGIGYYGTVKVEVTVESGKIANVKVVSYEDDDEYFLDAQNKVVKSILEEQSAEVDACSGATYSSEGIKKAVKEALEKARG